VLDPDTIRVLVAIEESLWSNDPAIYHDTYLDNALLIFPETGRIGRDIAVAAIRQENAAGRSWAEVRFDDVRAQWISRDTVALLTYAASARWNDESTASTTLCSTIYVQADGSWKVAFHQQTRRAIPG
jgi:hypothetical protein